MKNIISNKIFKDSGIWRLDGGKDIDYSDGSEHENYLNKILKSATDLSSDSDELTALAKDWTSEYHLSKKRAQLLNSFEFDKSSSVLEVGCGCGAISRYLGETFDEVISIEGTFARAKLAKERTKDLETVNIVNAPFQDLNFIKKFDIIICVGVFEYSSAFISGKDPHEEALSYFSSLLKPDGCLLIAIENQFGLKYYSSGKEDHTNIMFDGIEGYPRFPKMARTFGKEEIINRIQRHFSNCDFYYPYPDYKIPSLILSQMAFSKINAAELIANFHKPRSNEYFNAPLFDETLALVELQANKSLDFFANSFLIIANKSEVSKISFPQLGVFHNNNRPPCYQTKTIIKEHLNKIIVEKDKNLEDISDSRITEKLSLQPTTSEWIDGNSLQLDLYSKSRIKEISLLELFSPCKIWLDSLKQISKLSKLNEEVDGKYVDYIWQNSIIKDKEIFFIDTEWMLNSKISIKALAIRSIFHFLVKTRNISDLTQNLKSTSLYSLIISIGKALNLEFLSKDFDDFYNIEILMNQDSQKAANKLFLLMYVKYTWFFELSGSLKSLTKNILIILKGYVSRMIYILKRVFFIQ